MLDLISRGAQGHGPVHLLISAADLEFAWDGRSEVGCGFPPSPENDDWTCAAVLLFYFGGLAF